MLTSILILIVVPKLLKWIKNKIKRVESREIKNFKEMIMMQITKIMQEKMVKMNSKKRVKRCCISKNRKRC